MNLNDDEGDLILACPSVLTITHVEDDDKRARCKALAALLDGEPDAMFFGARPAGDEGARKSARYGRWSEWPATRIGADDMPSPRGLRTWS